MTMEIDLINKSYYKKVLDENKNGHSLQILGDMFMDEKKKETPEYSSIRYAQGEVYYLNKDYEAAIFKWENISDDDLKPWAKKNIADAHYEMDLLAIAEDYYKAVDTSSVVLKTEVLIQLFSLYIKLGKLEKATETIQSTVQLNPDYSGVTDMAKGFYEKYQDWGNAVKLAVNEAIRTKSLTWFSTLEGYIEQGHTVKIEPAFFNEALLALFEIDTFRFESFSTILWSSYRESDLYFQWLKEINKLLLNIDLKSSYIWKRFPDAFKETYYELVSGKFLIKEFSGLVQGHFSNWLRVSSDTDLLVSSTAVLAWDHIFPANIDADLVSEAENLLNMARNDQGNIGDGIELLESIKMWAKDQGLLDELSIHIKLVMEEHNIEEKTISNTLFIIKKSIEFLMQKRIEIESSIVDHIELNEELLAKLNGMHHHLSDMEEEKVLSIQKSFGKIKNDLRLEMMIKIPELLRNCSDLVKEDSDFGNIHVVLNDEMNNRISKYMEETALLYFREAAQGWIEDSERELKDCQANLNEMSESFNNIYTEKNIQLDCDFRVLEDWRRDVGRMTNGVVNLTKANIMMRYTPSQLVLKSAGKLFGTLSKSKEILQSKYKQFIEGADYSQAAEDIIYPFMQQLELFEKTLERDISMVFTNPFEVLNKTIEKAKVDIDKDKKSLKYLRRNPELYRDPLKIFELKLCQYEIMTSLDERIYESY
ncbi:hypothetical protein GCM10008967_18860 [Bacillus carboniphilus]|uniref:GTP-binding protein n=1 Tax=Bacillus carboniphilus TaxID=86663 RepID=A0ABN0W887_9BACI